jgi:hypothetical protein
MLRATVGEAWPPNIGHPAYMARRDDEPEAVENGPADMTHAA